MASMVAFLAGLAAGATSRAYREDEGSLENLKRSVSELEKQLTDRGRSMAERFDALDAQIAKLARQDGQQAGTAPAAESGMAPDEKTRDAHPNAAESQGGRQAASLDEPDSVERIVAALEDRLASGQAQQMARVAALESRLSEHAATVRDLPAKEEILKAVDARLTAWEILQDSRLASVESRANERDAAQSSRLAELENRLNDHAAKLADVPSTNEIVSAMEQFITRTMQPLEERAVRQERSVETLQRSVLETDNLLKQVRELLDSLRSSENPSAATQQRK